MPIDIPPGTRHAAICIGVDRTGSLQPLGGAVKGANDVAGWLGACGYHVIRHIDVQDDGSVLPVRLMDIAGSVHACVNAGTISKLVIYFAGHGYLNGLSEIWLLSGAPTYATEAVNLGESAEFARASGIPNVMFIADTCRATPQSMTAGNVTGGSIFPNRNPSPNVDPEIDRFFATRPGDVALEVALDEARHEYRGLFTDVLRQMFDEPEAGDVVALNVGGAMISTIMNRTLKEKLPSRFTSYAGNISAKIRQLPQLRLECDDDVYLAPVNMIAAAPGVMKAGIEEAIISRGPSAAADSVEAAPAHASGSPAVDASGDSAAAPAPTLEAETLAWLAEDGPSVIFRGEASNGQVSFEMEAIQADARATREAERSAHFETQCGFAVSGTRVADVFALDGLEADAETGPDGEAQIRVRKVGAGMARNDQPGSVLIRFAEGTGTILAALPGYIASLVVKGGLLQSVSYRPAPISDVEATSEDMKNVDRRRARAAAAVRHGALVLDRKSAVSFADMIKVGKRTDPSLGLYAALAYAEAGARAGTASVRECMQQDLGVELFDAWLLGGAGESPLKVVPLCPMLSQSWDYLRPRRVELTGILSEAVREQSLWTCFTPESMDRIMAAARKGDLT